MLALEQIPHDGARDRDAGRCADPLNEPGCHQHLHAGREQGHDAGDPVNSHEDQRHPPPAERVGNRPRQELRAGEAAEVEGERELYRRSGGPEGVHDLCHRGCVERHRDRSDGCKQRSDQGHAAGTHQWRCGLREHVPSASRTGAFGQCSGRFAFRRTPGYQSRDSPRNRLMILYPAIDLKDGQCVRLLRGDMDAATVFGEDPAAQARAFAAAGCQWLHIVDLNGAFAGRPVNGDAVGAVLGAVEVPVQLGGGIRDRVAIERWLEAGVKRVILGTVALRDPDLVRAAARAHPGRVAVGIDAREGLVAVEGWAETSDVTATDLARRFEDAGVAAIVYTDIDRDGAMQGPNVGATAALARAVSIPVIASGGVSSLDDLKALKQSGAPLDGVISGRALYEGRLDLSEAIRLLAA